MEWHRVDPAHELARLREFLVRSDPDDYLLWDLEEQVSSARLWVGEEGGSWVAFGRLHDLGDGQGWVSGLRVDRAHRGRGLGSTFLSGLVADARSIGLTELRAVIEDSNLASRRLFTRHGFRPVLELALRRGEARATRSPSLGPAHVGDRLPGPVEWVPGLCGRGDLLPGGEAGRFGRWDPRIVDRWAREGKLYLGADLAVAVQADWLTDPRTMWAQPLRGKPEELLPAIGPLAAALGQAEWQAFLPSTERLRVEYARLGLTPHPAWGDRVHLYEWVECPPPAVHRPAE